MVSSFYYRTAYILLDIPVPECFINLDKYLWELFSPNPPFLNVSAILAENLCRRMADIELYASYISEAQKNPDAEKGTILVGTFLVGYFTACKSLFDAGAITLARVYNLNLKNKEMDFSNSKFWKRLDGEVRPTIITRYAPFKPLSNEIVKWRNAAIHRMTPLVIMHSPDRPDMVPREKVEIKMVNQPDAAISTIAKALKDVQWVEPLYYHRQWQSQLIEFCKEVCLDIRSQTL